MNQTVLQYCEYMKHRHSLSVFDLRVHCLTEDVLTCNWDQTDNGRIYCIQRPGFHCNTDDISSEVTINIPQAIHSSHAGRYGCDTAPGEHRVVTVDNCEVDVRGLFVCCDSVNSLWVISGREETTRQIASSRPQMTHSRRGGGGGR